MTNKKRSPGGQPGNLNALKHGYFSRYFDENEKADLATLMSDKLDSEINMMRVLIQRIFKAAHELKDLDNVQIIDMNMGLLGTLGLAATRIARLMRTEKLLDMGEDGKLELALSDALAEVAAELNIEE